MVLRRSGCWNIVNGTESKPSTRDAAEKWEIKSEEGLTSIGLTIDADQYQYIEAATTGPAAWSALSKVYEKNSRGNRISLKRQFYGYEHNPSAPIQEYISGILGFATRLKAIGIKLEDNDIMDVLLFNLHAEWSNIAGTLCATTDDLDTVSDITGALLDEEGRRGGPSDSAASLYTRVIRRRAVIARSPATARHSAGLKVEAKKATGNAINARKKGILHTNAPRMILRTAQTLHRNFEVQKLP